MKNILKSLIPFAVTMSAFAQDVQQTQAPSDPNPSARFGTKIDQNFFFVGEAVWFKPLNAGYSKFQASRTTANSPANQTSATTNYTARSETFQPAFRLTAGYNTPWGGWDLLLSYTRFEYDHHNSFLNKQVGPSSSSFSNTNVQNSGKTIANWVGRDGYSINYNLADLDLGRMFKISKRLKMRPHVGVRGLWLTQKEYIPTTGSSDAYYSNYSTTSSLSFLNQLQGGTAISQRFKINSTLIGLEGGIDTLWGLSKEFSIFANLGLASLVNSQKISQYIPEQVVAQGFTQPGNTPSGAITPNGTPVTSTYVTDRNYYKSTRITNCLDFSIGLRWDKNLAHDNYHLGITVGYEQHSYFSMNQANVASTPINAINPGGNAVIFQEDFNLQGISCGARFDF